MKDITENVYWERNIKTRRNSNIANQVIRTYQTMDVFSVTDMVHDLNKTKKIMSFQCIIKVDAMKYCALTALNQTIMAKVNSMMSWHQVQYY